MQKTKTVTLLICCILAFAATITPTKAQPLVTLTIGTDLDEIGLTEVTMGSLVVLVTETGNISVSIDGLGTTSSTGTIQVDKPTGATVRKAYLAAASTGFSGRVLANGDVKINGTDVMWSINTVSGIASWNHWADVTSIVKPLIDAAAAGTSSLTITEVSSGGIDGVILAVIFDDPNQTIESTVVLLFGAQSTTGDTFFVNLGSFPTTELSMSLGISFGYQGSSQYSIVEVNSQRLSTSAGGQDDGQASNGALLTVGGLGDSNTNPANPYATPPGNSLYDDELYSLIPFLANVSSQQITVFTQNPSNDDNIFFAAFFGDAEFTVTEEPTEGEWDEEFEDTFGHNTTLRINDGTKAIEVVTPDGTFQKDAADQLQIIEDDFWGGKLKILLYEDEDIIIRAVAIESTDVCRGTIYDKELQEYYTLTDFYGSEET